MYRLTMLILLSTVVLAGCQTMAPVCTTHSTPNGDLTECELQARTKLVTMQAVSKARFSPLHNGSESVRCWRGGLGRGTNIQHTPQWSASGPSPSPHFVLVKTTRCVPNWPVYSRKRLL